MERNEKIEQPLQKAIDQLKMAMRTIYSDPRGALKLISAAKDNTDVGAIALHVHIGDPVKR